MDQERFDQLAKTLASGQSRRGLLKGLTGTTIGGLLAAVGMGEAVAKPSDKPSKCYGDGSKCTNGKQCCSGTCTNRTCAPSAPVDLCAKVTCTPTNDCYIAGTCNPDTGVCSPETFKLDGATCSTGTCDGAGTCNCTGLAIGAACQTTDQCCGDGAAVDCRTVGNLGQAECCRPPGATCSNPGQFTGCCATGVGSSSDFIYCGTDSTCGGAGAPCSLNGDNVTCASGFECQGDGPIRGECVAVSV